MSEDRYEIQFRQGSESFKSYGDDPSFSAVRARARSIAGRPNVRNVRIYRLRTVRSLVERIAGGAEGGE